jgi:hypothetical protein
MSPLQKGPGTIRANVIELMKGVESQSRKKAITTLAKKYNISRKEAMMRQAIAISKSQARK